MELSVEQTRYSFQQLHFPLSWRLFPRRQYFAMKDISRAWRRPRMTAHCNGPAGRSRDSAGIPAEERAVYRRKRWRLICWPRPSPA